MNQYREDEIRAVVNETVERRSYTAAHCHPASAIRRCTQYGVRSIEHGTLIDDETAEFVAKTGNYIVPTMAIIFGLIKMGRELGFPEVSQRKAEIAYEKALSGMDAMRRAAARTSASSTPLIRQYSAIGTAARAANADSPTSRLVSG